MLKEYTCIICPNGCDLSATVEGYKLLSLEGALCDKGRNYVIQELTAPQRTIASTVLVESGTSDQVSVRLTKPVPRERIFDLMNEIRSLRVEAPLEIGQIILKNVLGLDSDIIVTDHVPRKG